MDIDRLERLEQAVKSISLKLDMLGSQNHPSAEWDRLYSAKAGAYFWFNRITQQVIWEEESKDTEFGKSRWGKFNILKDGKLLNFYMNYLTGKAQLVEPDPNSRYEFDEEIDSIEGFNPGIFNPTSPMPGNESDHNCENKTFPKNIRKPFNNSSTENKYHWFMCSPANPYRQLWNIFLLVPCLTYLIIMVPYRIGFALEARGSILFFEMAVDVVFLSDIVINFRTGYEDQLTGEMELDPWKAAKSYLQTWFVIDCVSAIPVNLLNALNIKATGPGLIKMLKSGKVLSAFKMLRFVKLMRLVKALTLFSYSSRVTIQRFEDLFEKYIMAQASTRLVKILVAFCVAVHYLACFWVLIGRHNDKKGRPNWLEYDVYVGNLEGFNRHDVERGSSSVYISAYYYCFTVTTSVGFGDVHAWNDQERLYTIFLEAFGGLMYANIVAVVTSIVTSLDANKMAVEERMGLVSSYIKNRQFPDQLAIRIRRYFRYFYSSKTAIDEEKILTDLPASLRREASTFLMAGMITHIPIFKDLPSALWADLLPLLNPCRFDPGEIICVQGETCIEGFILLEGECQGCTIVDLSVNDLSRNESLRAYNEAQSYQKKEHNMKTRRPSTRTLVLSALNTSPTDSSGSALSRYAENMHVRVLTPGALANHLTLFNIYDKCLETIGVKISSEFYALNGKSFRNIFSEHAETFQNIKESCVQTSFHMFKDGSEFGIPLYMFPKEEIDFRTKAYDSWKKTQREKYAEVLRKHERDLKLARSTLRRATAAASSDPSMIKVNSWSKGFLFCDDDSNDEVSVDDKGDGASRAIHLSTDFDMNYSNNSIQRAFYDEDDETRTHVLIPSLPHDKDVAPVSQYSALSKGIDSITFIQGDDQSPGTQRRRSLSIDEAKL